MSRSPDIRVHPIDDRLAEVRGLVDELLGEWILEGDRSGPWRWVPAAKDAPESLPLARQRLRAPDRNPRATARRETPVQNGVARTPHARSTTGDYQLRFALPSSAKLARLFG